MIRLSQNPNYKPTFGPAVPVRAASVLVSEDCNLRCKYCFEKHMPHRMAPEIGRKALDFLFGNLKSGDGEGVSVTFFGGEPTLNPETIGAVLKHGCRLRKEREIPFHADMITNATLWTQKLEGVLARYRDEANLSVQLSIDGIQKVQDMYRVTKNGTGSFAMVENAVPKYRELFKDQPGRLSIHGCVNRFSLPYMYESYRFFKDEWGIPRIWFLPVCEEDWDAGDVELYREQMEKIHAHIMGIARREHSLAEIRHYAPLDRCLRTGKPDKPCSAGAGYVTITAAGEIYPCHQIYYNDPDKETLLGDVFDGVDDEKRRLFIEYDGGDLTCPGECDHGACYRCIATNWVQTGSFFSQVRGRYCEMMKIDRYFQDLMREELTEMGLLISGAGGPAQGGTYAEGGYNPANPACYCDVRAGQELRTCEVGCDLVEMSDPCLCNVRDGRGAPENTQETLRGSDRISLSEQNALASEALTAVVQSNRRIEQLLQLLLERIG